MATTDVAPAQKQDTAPTPKRPPVYHRNFAAFGAAIDLKAQVPLAPWPCARVYAVSTAAGVLTLRGEDGVDAIWNLIANVPADIPGSFIQITSFTGAGASASVSWSSRS